MFNAGTYEISNVHIFPFDQKQFFDFPEQNMNTLYYTVGTHLYQWSKFSDTLHGTLPVLYSQIDMHVFELDYY